MFPKTPDTGGTWGWDHDLTDGAGWLPLQLAPPPDFTNTHCRAQRLKQLWHGPNRRTQMGSLIPLCTADLSLSGPPSGLSSQTSQRTLISHLSTFPSGPRHPFCSLSPALPTVVFATMPLQISGLAPGSAPAVMQPSSSLLPRVCAVSDSH